MLYQKELMDIGYSKLDTKKDYTRPFVQEIYYKFGIISFIIQGYLKYDKTKDYVTFSDIRLVDRNNKGKIIVSDYILTDHLNVPISVISDFYYDFEIDEIIDIPFYVAVVPSIYKSDDILRGGLKILKYGNKCTIIPCDESLDEINRLFKLCSNYNKKSKKIGVKEFNKRQKKEQNRKIQTLAGTVYF
jgi:hypothetical protein